MVAVAPSVVLGKPFAVRAAQIAVLAPFAGVGGLARADTVVALPSIHAISKRSIFIGRCWRIQAGRAEVRKLRIEFIEKISSKMNFSENE